MSIFELGRVSNETLFGTQITRTQSKTCQTSLLGVARNKETNRQAGLALLCHVHAQYFSGPAPPNQSRKPAVVVWELKFQRRNMPQRWFFFTVSVRPYTKEEPTVPLAQLSPSEAEAVKPLAQPAMEIRTWEMSWQLKRIKCYFTLFYFQI